MTDPMRTCPECGDPLQDAARDGVPVDECPSHGIWLDQGELDEVLRRRTANVRVGQQRARRNACRRAFEQGRSGGASAVFWLDAGYSRRRRVRRRKLQLPQRATDPDPEAREPFQPREARQRPCVVCGETMTLETWVDRFKRVPPVDVDICERHGLWLDHGELEPLVERARSDAKRLRASRRERAAREAYEDGLRHDGDDAGGFGWFLW